MNEETTNMAATESAAETEATSATETIAEATAPEASEVATTTPEFNCGTCHKADLTADDFSILQTGKRSTTCKACRAAAANAWTTERADYRKEFHKALRAKNEGLAVVMPKASTWKQGDIILLEDGRTLDSVLEERKATKAAERATKAAEKAQAIASAKAERQAAKDVKRAEREKLLTATKAEREQRKAERAADREAKAKAAQAIRDAKKTEREAKRAAREAERAAAKAAKDAEKAAQAAAAAQTSAAESASVEDAPTNELTVEPLTDVEAVETLEEIASDGTTEGIGALDALRATFQQQS